jgi:3-deoxy-D-manno-octulosonic-acid transferase
MARIRPSLLLLAELELWPNFVRAAKQSGASVAIFNGRLSERSFRGYRRVRWLLAPVLRQLDAVAVQNDEYAERFVALGTPAARVRVTGSLKFDGAQGDRGNAKTMQLARLAGIGPEDIVFLAGSTQEPEEQLAIEAFEALADEHPRLKLVIVPRHPHRFDEVAALLERSRFTSQRRSQLAADSRQGAEPARGRILLVDTVGELGAWWGTAKIGFVGGSLYSSRGGQNMIEPAAYGVAVSFGPNTQNFRDVVAMLLSAEAAVRVTSGEELTGFVRRCLEEPAFAERLGENARGVVAAQHGATERTWNVLGPLLPALEGSRVSRREAA